MAYKRPANDAERAQAARVREEKLVALQERLAEQVQAITAGEQWAAWLRSAGRFHSYSWGNTMLIQLQNPDATKVAGYKLWAQMGRQVRKGETGIAILAPVVRRSAPRELEATGSTASKSDQTSPEIDSDKPARRVVAFRPVHVFDISQTDGEPLAEPPRPQLTRGQAPEGLWAALAAQVKAAGFDLSTSPLHGPGGPDGVTNFQSQTVTVRSDFDDAHAVTTLVHELAHVLMHDPAGFVDGQTSRCRGDAEVEAESVAYLVASVHGIDSDDYTFPYVAGWIGRNDPATVLETTGKRVLATAHSILDQVDTAMAIAGTSATSDRASAVLEFVVDNSGVTPQSALVNHSPATAEAPMAHARWVEPVREAGGEGLVKEPIRSQVATELEGAAGGRSDAADALPSRVKDEGVTELRLIHVADLNPTENQPEPPPPTVRQVAPSGVRAQRHSTAVAAHQSASTRSR